MFVVIVLCGSLRADIVRVHFELPQDHKFIVYSGEKGTNRSTKELSGFSSISVDIPAYIYNQHTNEAGEQNWGAMFSEMEDFGFSREGWNDHPAYEVKTWNVVRDSKTNKFVSKESDSEDVLYSYLKIDLKRDNLKYSFKKFIKEEAEGKFVEPCEHCKEKPPVETKAEEEIVAVIEEGPKEPEGDPNFKPKKKKPKPKTLDKLPTEFPEIGYCDPSKQGESFNTRYPIWSRSSRNMKDRNYCYNTGAAAESNKVCRGLNSKYPIRAKNNCKKGLALKACQNNIWRGVSLKDRFGKIHDMAKKINPELGLPASYTPCMAARETANLNLNSRTKNFCTKPRTYRATGLFQVVPPTNSDTARIGAYHRYLKNKPKIKALLKKKLSARTYAFLVDPNAKDKNGNYLINRSRRNSGINPKTKNDRLCTKNPDCNIAQKELFNAMADDLELQNIISGVIMLVKGKVESKEMDKGSFSKNRLKQMLKHYYGAGDSTAPDKRYDKKILSCMSCVDSSSKDEAHRCMVLARNDHRSYGKPTLSKNTEGKKPLFSFETYRSQEEEDCDCETLNR